MKVAYSSHNGLPEAIGNFTPENLINPPWMYRTGLQSEIKYLANRKTVYSEAILTSSFSARRGNVGTEPKCYVSDFGARNGMVNFTLKK